MLSITLPAFTPHLLAADIDPMKLQEALSAYLEEMGVYIGLNYSEFYQPIEYLEASDIKQKVSDFTDAFIQLTPVELLDDESCRMEDP